MLEDWNCGLCGRENFSKTETETTYIRNFFVIACFVGLFVYRVGTDGGRCIHAVDVVAVDIAATLVIFIVVVHETIFAGSVWNITFITATAVTIICIVVVVIIVIVADATIYAIVIGSGGATIGAGAATTTCAVGYARLWFDSNRSSHVVVPIAEIIRGSRRGCHELGAAGGRSIQRGPQLDRGLRYGLLQFGSDVQRFHCVGGTRIVCIISTG